MDPGALHRAGQPAQDHGAARLCAGEGSTGRTRRESTDLYQHTQRPAHAIPTKAWKNCPSKTWVTEQWKIPGKKKPPHTAANFRERLRDFHMNKRPGPRGPHGALAAPGDPRGRSQPLPPLLIPSGAGVPNASPRHLPLGPPPRGNLGRRPSLPAGGEEAEAERPGGDAAGHGRQ